jgi:hypothetical protein
VKSNAAEEDGDDYNIDVIEDQERKLLQMILQLKGTVH